MAIMNVRKDLEEDEEVNFDTIIISGGNLLKDVTRDDINFDDDDDDKDDKYV